MMRQSDYSDGVNVIDVTQGSKALKIGARQFRPETGSPVAVETA